MDQEQEIQRGYNFKILVTSPIWQEVLDVMENRVKVVEDDLLNYQGSDPEVIKAFHRRAVASRNFFHQFQYDMQTYIDKYDEESNERT